MIAIKDFKMPVDCSVCFGRGAIWCRFDESDRIVVPAFPDELFEGRPDWCPLVEVPDMNVGKCSEIPNNSDGEYDPKPDIYYLAEKIGIHRLYALVVQLRGEPEPCIDTIERQAAIDALLELVEARRTWISTEDARKEISGIDASMCAIHDLPSVQPEIIICLDCVHYEPLGKEKAWGRCSVHSSPTDNQRFVQSCDFCAWAERKTDD